MTKAKPFDAVPQNRSTLGKIAHAVGTTLGYAAIGALCVGSAALVVEAGKGAVDVPHLVETAKTAAEMGAAFVSTARWMGGRKLGRYILGMAAGPAVLMSGLVYAATKASGFGSYGLGMALNGGPALDVMSQGLYWGCVAVGGLAGLAVAHAKNVKQPVMDPLLPSASQKRFPSPDVK